MPIKQTFIEHFPPGTEPIYFGEWLDKQPASEQSRYYQSRARMDEYREEAIADGRMIIDNDGSYIWRDEQAKQQGKHQDNECLEFYNRYNAEVGLTVTSVWTEI